MKQRIRKAFGALSRGQLIRLDNSVPIEYREPVFDPDTIGICCTDGGADSGCDCQDGVTFGYCCSVGGDFTPNPDGETLNCSSFECCPEPPPDPDGTCCSPCPEDGTVNGVKSTTKQSQCSGTWTEGEANCPRCPNFGRCCPPCEGFPNNFGGESTRVPEADCDGQWTDTDDQTCDECPEGGCCCFLNSDGELDSQTILGPGAAAQCAARGGIFSPGEDCVLVDCTQYSICCQCNPGCEASGGGVIDCGTGRCSIEFEDTTEVESILVEGTCGGGLFDADSNGVCSREDPLTGDDLCGCPCNGVGIDLNELCDYNGAGCGNQTCNTCSGCGNSYVITVIGSVNACCGSGEPVQCECFDNPQQGGPQYDCDFNC